MNFKRNYTPSSRSERWERNNAMVVKKKSGTRHRPVHIKVGRKRSDTYYVGSSRIEHYIPVPRLPTSVNVLGRHYRWASHLFATKDFVWISFDTQHMANNGIVNMRTPKLKRVVRSAARVSFEMLFLGYIIGCIMELFLFGLYQFTHSDDRLVCCVFHS